MPGTNFRGRRLMKEKTLSRDLVDLMYNDPSVMNGRCEPAIYLCENNRYVWNTRGNKSSCWDKQQVVEKSGFPLMALLEVATGHDIIYSKRDGERQKCYVRPIYKVH